jgi:hypothetical protein
MIPWLQNLVLKDFWLKLFSFALAGLTWFTVNMAIKNDISPVASLSLTPTEQLVLRDLPIILLSSAANDHAFSINPKSAIVTLQGDPSILRNIRKQEVRLVVDLTDAVDVQDLHKRIEVSTPAGITHVKVDPEEVLVAATPKN